MLLLLTSMEMLLMRIEKAKKLGGGCEREGRRGEVRESPGVLPLLGHLCSREKGGDQRHREERRPSRQVGRGQRRGRGWSGEDMRRRGSGAREHMPAAGRSNRRATA